MKWKFWKKKPKTPSDGITRTEGKTETKGFQHNENLSTSTNSCISVAAFEGGVVQIHVDGPTPDVTLDLFKKVHAEIKEDLKKKRSLDNEAS
jgi:hypothetical protein